MSMGNYLGGASERHRVMATKQPTGMDHLTVVPTNFDPDIDEPVDGDTTAPDQ